MINEIIHISKMINQCKKCMIGSSRTKACPGNISNIKGNKVDMMLIGEAPGEQEDLSGKVFVGRAGKLLRNAIKEVGLDGFFITNVVKCRPDNNRNPTKEEIANCLPFLFDQIDAINPKVIICIGNVAHEAVYEAFRGTDFFKKRVKLYHIWHPAYILRKMSLYNEWIENIRRIKHDKEKGNG